MRYAWQGGRRTRNLEESMVWWTGSVGGSRGFPMGRTAKSNNRGHGSARLFVLSLRLPSGGRAASVRFAGLWPASTIAALSHLATRIIIISFIFFFFFFFLALTIRVTTGGIDGLRTGSVEWSRGFPGAGLSNLVSVGHGSTRLVGLTTHRDYLPPPPPPITLSNVCLLVVRFVC